MKPSTNHRSNRPAHALCLLSGAALLANACVVEQIDAIIAERGVTYCPSSTGESGGSSDTSTSTSTSAETSAEGTVGSDASTSSDETTIMSTGTGSSSSTGPQITVCGDGIVEGEEACDDGNPTPGDGCQECAKDSIVFITSEVYQGFALGGLYGADQRCQSLAAKAGLQRFLTFRAWLSTSTISVADRLHHSRGRYILVNGLVVAQNWDALTLGALENPIIVDEYSQTRDDIVWTGTLASGQPALGSEFCNGWDDEAAVFEYGGVGLSVNTDAAWSFFEHGPCDSELRLYCFEQ
ncbi:MAG: DUF4215 domain-containing protein [Nannocystis sp.]|nr:DUF4215 domain-containing protein [Nannocystis sp.]MBA3550576.1 DUF4215 domain-containing protein [Nannocystis sp.]